MTDPKDINFFCSLTKVKEIQPNKPGIGRSKVIVLNGSDKIMQKSESIAERGAKAQNKRKFKESGEGKKTKKNERNGREKRRTKE